MIVALLVVKLALVSAASPPPSTESPPRPSRPSRWRPTPGRLAALLVGLWLFGMGEALLVASALGNSPWLVLSEGLAAQAPLSVGLATNVIGAGVLALWLPLRQRPGLGTVANILIIGVAVDATLAVLPRLEAIELRAGAVGAGIALVAVGSGFYLGAALGPGPRDGLMTGLHRVTGRSVALVRGTIEVSVAVARAVLGGTAGIGTLLFAVLIGPSVQVALRALSRLPAVDL